MVEFLLLFQVQHLSLIIEAMKTAKDSGAITSFDLNFREKLWKPQGGIQKAQETIRKIVEHVDVL